MAAVIRSSPAVILPLIQAKIMADMGFPAERCFFALDPPPFDSQADQYIFMTPGDATLNDPVFFGGGRFDDRNREQLLVCLRTRLETDEPDRATNYLLTAQLDSNNTPLGHMIQRHKLRGALSGFYPADAAGNGLLVGEMQVRTVGKPTKSKKSAEWGESWLMCVYQYSADQIPGLG